MAEPIIRIKDTDQDITVYEKVTSVEDIEVFTIEQLDQQITDLQARLDELKQRKIDALAISIP